MPDYRVTWEINLHATSPREAAEGALRMHRDPDSTATVFEVTDENGHTERIDLDDSADAEVCAACGCSLEDKGDAVHAPTGRSYCRECFDQGQG